jgi:Transcriptional regulator DIP2311-like, C-terminal domain
VPRRAANGRTDLKATQKRVLAALEDDGSARLTRGLYEEIAGVSRSQAAYDLAELVSAGILERIGGGRSTWYRVVRHERLGQRRWTDDKIRAALELFCSGRASWPSASEFKEAGHSDLYVAASRYGGIAFWTKELGFSRPARTTPEPAAPPPAERRRRRPRLRWATAGLAFAAALFAAGGASLSAWHGSAHRAASSGVPQGTHAPVITLRVPKLRATHTTVSKPKPRQVKRVTHAAPAYTAPSSHAELAVRTVSAPTREAVSTRSTSSSQPSRSSSQPAPLTAPTGGSGPPPPLPPPNG